MATKSSRVLLSLFVMLGTIFSIGSPIAQRTVEASSNAMQVPDFVLPYYNNPPFPPGGAPKWTGGPHQWARDPSVIYADSAYTSGIDFSINGFTSFTVASMTAGTVIYASDTGDYKGLGHIVAVKSDVGGTVLIYSHLQAVYPPILSGSGIQWPYHVEPGSTIGSAGKTGAGARGVVHLHVEMRDGSDTCCDVTHSGGNPLSWNGKIIGDYKIFDYRPNIMGYVDGKGLQAFNYDGLAIKIRGEGAVSLLDLVGYDHFSYIDDLTNGNKPHRDYVYTTVPSGYNCTIDDCEEYNYPGVVYSGKGVVGGGGVLISTTVLPTEQPQPTGVAPTPTEPTLQPFPNWLLEFWAISASGDDVQIHTKVDAIDGVYASQRLTVDGNVIMESAAAEINFTWRPAGVSVGYHTLKVQYRKINDPTDWSGTGEYAVQYYVTRESNPPETYASYPEPNGKHDWSVSPVTVILSAFDDTGVAQTYHTINGSSPMTGTNFTISVDGIYNVCYWSVDVYDNIESQKCFEIKLDQTPPVTTGKVSGPRDINGIFRDVVNANLSPTDAMSGVDYLECSWDNGTTWQVTTPWNITVSGNGIHQFFCRATDIAGNIGLPLDSGPIIINMYAVFNSSSQRGFRMYKATNISITGEVYTEQSPDFTSNTGVHFIGSLLNAGTAPWIYSGNTNFVIDYTAATLHIDKIDYPFNYYWERCDQVYPNGLNVSSVSTEMSGVICINGDFTMTGVNITGDVTFVVNGNIYFNPTCGWYHTSDPDNGMVMYATGDVDLRGNCYDILGLVYSNQNIYVHNTDVVIRGSLVAPHVEYFKATGSTLIFTAAFAPGTFTLPLDNEHFADPILQPVNQVPAPSTLTPAPPTQTPSITPSPTRTSTPSQASTSTRTSTPTRTPTKTPTPTRTLTPTKTFTPTSTYTPTRTPTPSPTPSPTAGPNTGFLNPSYNVPGTTGDGNGFEFSPVNAYVNDSIFAIDNNSGTNLDSNCASTGKDSHSFYNYNISLPAGAEIRGVEVQIDSRVDSTFGSPVLCVQLSWDGGITWTTTKTTPTLTTSESTIILGGSTDTWGRSWTVGEFTNTNFRVRVISAASSSLRDFYLDWLSVRVHY